MKRRWYYFRRAARQSRMILPAFFAALACLFAFFSGRRAFAGGFCEVFDRYGVQVGGAVLERFVPALAEPGGGAGKDWLTGRSALLGMLEEMGEEERTSRDPSYERLYAGADGPGTPPGSGAQEETGIGSKEEGARAGAQTGSAETKIGTDPEDMERGDDFSEAGEAIAIKPPGETIIMDKLADYDYMMQSFYSVHPTTTAGRDLMSAKQFMNMDFSLEKDPDAPQILIYHTHSQEEFADYPENPEATIVGVGARLTELLEAGGYGVIHDTTVYDLRNGKLDRSQAYTYALDGISGILQRNPSIEVVIDVHRDGVKPGVRLVTEVAGKPTAQIMFFNGMSQTPDGPIEYLPNPNREANLAFSFQLQLAAGKYPGFTRKIYLKGLRYNEHVRARSLLVEVGAQTNTYEEARNAMVPLSKILGEVLGG